LRENLENLNEGEMAATDDRLEGRTKPLSDVTKAVRQSKWFAVLSSKMTHQFVRIVPADIGLVVKLT
jgi:hypothetical protein